MLALSPILAMWASSAVCQCWAHCHPYSCTSSNKSACGSDCECLVHYPIPFQPSEIGARTTCCVSKGTTVPAHCNHQTHKCRATSRAGTSCAMPIDDHPRHLADEHVHVSQQ